MSRGVLEPVILPIDSPIGARMRCVPVSEACRQAGSGMANKISLPSNWKCDGKELKPRSGASFSNTWVFDGKEIKTRSGASFSNTWVWNGKELKPKSGASFSNTWVVDGNRVKPKTGANSGNTYDCGDENILVIAGKVALKLY